MRKPASRETASASVELCETEVCFLHNLLIRTCDVRKYAEFLLMLTSNLQGLLQNQSLETIQVCIAVLCFPHNNIACVHLYDECTISRAKRLSQAFVHFVTARASLFADQKISGLPIRATSRHFRTICEQTVDNSSY